MKYLRTGSKYVSYPKRMWLKVWGHVYSTKRSRASEKTKSTAWQWSQSTVHKGLHQSPSASPSEAGYKLSSTLILPAELELPRTHLELGPAGGSDSAGAQNHCFRTLSLSWAFKALWETVQNQYQSLTVQGKSDSVPSDGAQSWGFLNSKSIIAKFENYTLKRQEASSEGLKDADYTHHIHTPHTTWSTYHIHTHITCTPCIHTTHTSHITHPTHSQTMYTWHIHIIYTQAHTAEPRLTPHLGGLGCRTFSWL